jgi:hypothetical protein
MSDTDNYNPATLLKTSEARCKSLETALKVIHTWASCDESSPESRKKAMSDIANCARSSLYPCGKVIDNKTESKTL